jgi:hypothetical protein
MLTQNARRSTRRNKAHGTYGSHRAFQLGVGSAYSVNNKARWIVKICIDYRKLIEVTFRDSDPLPRMDDCLDSLGSATIFTTLDANRGYWQLEVSHEDRDKTSFTSHMGTYRFTRMAFGLVNAPGTFQRSIDVLLTKVLWTKAKVYLDNIIFFLNIVEAHLRDVDEVLGILDDAVVILSLKKCKFFGNK